MANNTSGGNRINVPQAKGALDNMKYEIARELGVNLKQGYNGDIAAKDAGHIGGNMVKKMCPIRTATYARTCITAAGRKVMVRYVVSIAV